MNARRAVRLARISVLAALGLTVTFVYLAWLSGKSDGPLEYSGPVAVVAWSLPVVMYPLLGALVASRHPSNVIGWMFCASGLCIGAALCTQIYAEYDLYGRGGELPGG